MSLFPRSLRQQLDDAHEASGETFMWHHIDTCLSCFLNDHHHRDGELLLGAFVDGKATVGQVLASLVSEFQQVGWDIANERAGYDHDKATEALARLIAENADRSEKLFDSSLEIRKDDEDDDGENCQAWFLLTWEVEDEASDS